MSEFEELKNDLITPAELAEYIPLSERTIRNYCRTGKIIAYQFGGEKSDIYISRKSALEFINNSRITNKNYILNNGGNENGNN